MLIEKLVAPLFAANTYIFIPENSAVALVVDPGYGHACEIQQFLADKNVEVGAVLCTHGHADHTWDAAKIAGDAPVYLPAGDKSWIDNPLQSGNPVLLTMSKLIDNAFVKPTNLVLLGESAARNGFSPIEGLPMRMVAAPGHSQGSSFFLFEGPITGGNLHSHLSHYNLFALSGDVIFKGSVGRTDLPESDPRQMLHTLRTLQNVIDPATQLLPGHGELTSMEQEKFSNPHLTQARYQG